MAEDLSPSDIRARKFASARRGYSRGEVAEFLTRVGDRLEQVETELATLQTAVHQLGITHIPDLKEEIEDIGVEIQSVLDSAMAAAEGMRTRAAEDAASTLGEADQVSRELRGDAWSTGTTLLDQAGQEADRIVREAGEDALFIRAQAEQDAKRLVAEARRQADEMLRSSREEGERIVVVAKAESEAILEGARQSAEQAQERARALENRRSELLNELEAAESAVRDAETGRAQRDAGDSTVRIIGGGSDRTHWPDDDGSVRVLPTEAPVPAVPEPVDAEEVAAEVERMRSAVARTADEPKGELEDGALTEEPSDAAPVDAVESPPDAEISGQVEEASAAEAADDTDVASEPEEAAREVPETVPADETLEDRPAPSTDKVTIVEGDQAIDDLFAKLRQSVDEPDEPAPQLTPLDGPVDSDHPGKSDQPADDDEPAERDQAAEEHEPTGSAPVGEVAEDTVPSAPVLTVVPDPQPTTDFDVRDRRLLPIENQALRGLKRRIVELQNTVLEGLRRAPGEWRLGHDQVVDIMGDELDAVLFDSFRAGHAAAAEAVGQTEADVTGGPEQGAAELFTADLYRNVQAVLDRGDPGSRRLSAEVGRVFRSWRTDEAERHVRRAARRAYNDGLLAAYGKLGVAAVEVVAPGRPCGRCSAGTEVSWNPATAPPEGTPIPPVGPSCEGLIVPFVRDGSNSGAGQ